MPNVIMLAVIAWLRSSRGDLTITKSLDIYVLMDRDRELLPDYAYRKDFLE